MDRSSDIAKKKKEKKKENEKGMERVKRSGAGILRFRPPNRLPRPPIFRRYFFFLFFFSSAFVASPRLPRGQLVHAREDRTFRTN